MTENNFDNIAEPTPEEIEAHYWSLHYDWTPEEIEDFYQQEKLKGNTE